MKIFSQADAVPGQAVLLDQRPLLLYLALPALLFLLNFVQTHIGLPTAGLILCALVYAMRERAEGDGWMRGYWQSALLGAVLVLSLTGFVSGHFNWDWIKHWAILNELSARPWPVAIELNGSVQYLRFYFAAYLVPALVHHSIPLLPLVWLTAAWFGLGLIFVFRYVAAYSVAYSGANSGANSDIQRRAWQAVLLLLVLGGADFYAEQWFRYTNHLPVHSLFGVRYWVSANGRLPIEYSSFLTSLTWVPHQSIASFLVAAMLIHVQTPTRLAQALLAFGLLGFWSPFGMIGLLPLLLFQVAKNLPALSTRTCYLAAAAGVCFTLVVIAFLAADAPAAVVCLSCIPGRLKDVQALFYFLAVELLPFVLILRRRLWQEPSCLVALASLVLIPLAYGETGDFVCRVSLGPLFVLGLHAIQALFAEQNWSGLRSRFLPRTCVILALCLCLPATISEAVFQLQGGRAHLAYHGEDSYNGSWLYTFADRTDYTMAGFLDISGWHFAPQYLTPVPPFVLKQD